MSKKQLLNAFTHIPPAGVCTLDRNKMKKAFDINCRILVQYDYKTDKPKEFTLLHYTPKAKRNLRITISEDDANWLIREFSLTEVPTHFSHSLAYVPCVIA